MKEEGVKILKSLANNRRMKIIEVLKNDSLDVNDIAERIGLSYKSTSKHLQKMVEAKLIKRHPQGKNVYHLIDRDSLKLLATVERYIKNK